MLTKTILTAVLGNVLQTDTTDAYVPRANTAVSELVAASADSTTILLDDDKQFIEQVSRNSMVIEPGENASEHDLLMDMFTKAGTRSIESVMNTVTNYIIPTMTQCYEDAVNKTEAYINVTEVPCEIYYVDDPEMLRSNAITSEVDRLNALKATPITDQDATIIASRMTEAVATLINLETGFQDLNGFLKDFITALGTDPVVVLGTLEKVFASRPDPIVLSDMRTATDRINNTVARLALGIALRDNPPAGVTMDLSAYREKMLSYSITAANSLTRMFGILNAYRTKRQLIIASTRSSQRSYSVSVYKPMMDELISQYGGDTNTVLGCVVVGNSQLLDEVVNRKDEFNRMAAKTLNTYRLLREEKSSLYMREALYRSMADEVKGFEPDDLPRPLPEILKALRYRADTDTELTPANAYDYARDWLIDCVYCDPNLRLILAARSAARDAKSDVASTEANYTAVVELVCEYLAQQLDVTADSV